MEDSQNVGAQNIGTAEQVRRNGEDRTLSRGAALPSRHKEGPKSAQRERSIQVLHLDADLLASDVERFGEQYEAYMQKTGRFFPSLW